MTRVTTHVLDTARGRPAADVPVALERADGDGWETLARARTDRDGRVATFPAVTAGRHRLTFDTAAHLGAGGFFPEVAVVFELGPDDDHCHVPLLLSPFGYSTYRGS
jgi:5-hydroxyisourate hydrolase